MLDINLPQSWTLKTDQATEVWIQALCPCVRCQWRSRGISDAFSTLCMCALERREGTFVSLGLAPSLLWPHPQPNLQPYELMQQEFIYRLIIPVTHVQLELGCNEELGSGPARVHAHEAWEDVSQDQQSLTTPRAKRADGRSAKEMPALQFVLALKILGLSQTLGVSPTQRPQMEGLAGNLFLTCTSPNVPGNSGG